MAHPHRRRGHSHAWLALVVAALLTGCGPSPDDPEREELTGVVVSGGDSFVLGGGGVTDAYDRVLVLTPEELLEAYRRTWPGKDDPLDHQYRGLGVRIPVADLEQLVEQAEPASAQAVAPVVDGRFGIPWASGPRYVCLGDEARVGTEAVVATGGCVLVDQAPPAAITIEVHLGGLAVSD